MGPEDARRLALALPEAVEAAHMGHPDFRVRGKIFASLPDGGGRVVVKLTPGHQQMFVEAEPHCFAPVNGGWDKRGWTSVDLAAVDETTLASALLAAWRTVAPKRLAAAQQLAMFNSEKP